MGDGRCSLIRFAIVRRTSVRGGFARQECCGRQGTESLSFPLAQPSSGKSPGVVITELHSFHSQADSRLSSMPVVERTGVPDTEAQNVASVRVLKSAITALAQLACASARYKASSWLLTGNLPNHSDEAMQYAQIWCNCAYSRIEEILSTCPRRDQWWEQLKHKVHHWLTLKHDVLEFAGKRCGVAPSDIADQIVSYTLAGSQNELTMSRGLTIEHLQYGDRHRRSCWISVSRESVRLECLVR